MKSWGGNLRRRKKEEELAQDAARENLIHWQKSVGDKKAAA